MNKVPSQLTKAFPNSRPLVDKPEIQKCVHCKRAVTKHTMPKHVEGCLNKKQEKQRKKKEAKDARDAAARKEKNAANGVADSDDDDDAATADGTKTTIGSKTGMGTSGAKKRKAADTSQGDDNTPEAPAKKKSKKSGSANDLGKNGTGGKPNRAKAPVDVEKQCGVELPLGGQCARSLTCKSHSMGAKRAVPGRSAPYDKLLLEYQRKNQAKMQKAQFDATAPAEDEEMIGAGPVDSDEERESVMAGIARAWGGRPLWQPTIVPLRARYQHNRIKGMLQSAFGNRGGGSGGPFGSSSGGGGFFGSSNNPPPGPSNSIPNPASATASAAPTVDDNGIIHARRGSVVPGARSMMAPAASRKASVANVNASSNLVNSGSAAAAAVGA